MVSLWLLVGQVLIEESVIGWEELKVEVIRIQKQYDYSLFIENVIQEFAEIPSALLRCSQ